MSQEVLDDEQIDERLEELNIWSRGPGRLMTRVEFENYQETVFFANTVFAVAESEFHHPDVKVEYGAVEIDLTTHEADGVTEKDFEMAEKIEEKLGSIDWS